jgi:endonuclease/exonuclease/phosphatase (EEP) superfamily protein YafD
MFDRINWKSPLKNLFDGIFFLAAILVIAISLGGYLGEMHQNLELISHFKVQYLLLGFIPFFYFALRRRKTLLMISCLCLIINLIEIVPFYIPYSFDASSAEGQKLRVFLSNVEKRKDNYASVIALVREEKPDIAVFLEVGESGAKKLQTLKDILPYSNGNQDTDYDGATIYSNISLENKSVKSLGGGRKVITGDIAVQGKTISILAPHPSMAIGQEYFEERNRQLAAIGDYTAELKNPAIVLGDLNVTMWSPYYKQLVRKGKLENARRGFGILPTWPTFHPMLYIPIDHCLISRNIKVVNFRRGREMGSDHLPIIVDLVIGK